VENILNLENWITCGHAILKMLEWGWPVVVAFAGFMVWEHVTTHKIERAK
tara:strand:- start:215 stop:364 length:150 start_codon:yes stop_codon:yes gene_type:complete